MQTVEAYVSKIRVPRGKELTGLWRKRLPFRSAFLRNFVSRGFYNDCTDTAVLDALFANERVTAYIGFDCTAPSLTSATGADHDAAPASAGRT